VQVGLFAPENASTLDYSGGDENSVSHEFGKIKTILCSPNTYEQGIIFSLNNFDSIKKPDFESDKNQLKSETNEREHRLCEAIKVVTTLNSLFANILV